MVSLSSSAGLIQQQQQQCVQSVPVLLSQHEQQIRPSPPRQDPFCPVPESTFIPVEPAKEPPVSRLLTSYTLSDFCTKGQPKHEQLLLALMHNFKLRQDIFKFVSDI